MNSAIGWSRAALLILAWTLLAASWFGIVAALRSFWIANREYGALSARTFLDAGFGYYGFFAFAMAAVAVLVAGRGRSASKPKWFIPFKATLLFSLVFLLPVLYSMVAFLVK